MYTGVTMVLADPIKVYQGLFEEGPRVGFRGISDSESKVQLLLKISPNGILLPFFCGV